MFTTSTKPALMDSPRLNTLTFPAMRTYIEVAAKKAGRPWKESEICRQAKALSSKIFEILTPQVVGRWIDKEARAEGVFKWKDSVLESLPTGAAPGGQSTRAGVLVSSCPVYSQT